MKQIGKIGKINLKANKILKDKFTELGIGYCEIQLPGCMGTFGLSFAHRHKRMWYRSQPELLSSIDQVVLSCASCHQKIEQDAKLTEEVFERLRP
jgi:hypothetical protein